MDPGLWPLVEREGRDTIAVLIRVAPHAELPAAVRVVSRFGDVVTARVRRNEVLAVREHPAVLSIKAPRAVRPEPNAEAPARRPPTQHHGKRHPGAGPTGRGVVVAVIDWGVDITHPNFLRADGCTRLLALWDQRPSGERPTNRFGYGRVLSRRRIDRALAADDPFADLDYDPRDVDVDATGTHGTHVLDIAAGASRLGPGGVAPSAELIFVHLAAGRIGPRHLGNSVSLLEAIDFASEVAGERPLVVNLSLGSHAGPHDGSTLVELALDAFCAARPGRAIVQSAGNYRQRPIHASGRLEAGQRASIGWEVSPADETANELDLWYPSHALLVARLHDDNGRVVAVATPDSHGPITRDGRAIGRFAHRTHDPNNRDNHVALIVDPRRSDVTRWRVELEPVAIGDAPAYWHAWIERDESSAASQSRLAHGDASSEATTGTIANGRDAIVVGALDPATGSAAGFSSRGPTRDGRAKPDLLAPGVGIVAARSVPGEDDWTGHPSLTRKTGTSMAAPHVAGAVALLYQAAGRALTIGEVRAALGIVEGQEATALDLVAALARLRQDASPGFTHSLVQPPPPVNRATTTQIAELEALPQTHWVGSPAQLFDALTRDPQRARRAALEPWVEVVARPGAAPRTELIAGDLLVERVLGGGSMASARVITQDGRAAATRPRWNRLVLRLRAIDGAHQIIARRSPSRPTRRSIASAREDDAGYPAKPIVARIRVHRFGLDLVASSSDKFEVGRDKTQQGLAALTYALVGVNQYSPELAALMHTELELIGTGGLVGQAEPDESVRKIFAEADLALKIITWLRDDRQLVVHLDGSALATLAQASAVAYAWKVVDDAAGRDLQTAHEIIRTLNREAPPYDAHRWLWNDETVFTNLAWTAETLVTNLVDARARPPGDLMRSMYVEQAVTALWQRFNKATDPLEAIRSDPTLTTHLAYRLLWNLRVGTGAAPATADPPVPEDVKANAPVVTRCLELVLARFANLGKSAIESRKDRRALLDKFEAELEIIGQFITVGQGNDLIAAEIAKANAPPFGGHLKTWPALAPPLFAVPARSELSCSMSVNWDHWTSAFGARYHWELLKLDAGDWQPVSGTGALTVLGRRLERQMEYTWTDYQRLRGAVVDQLGPPGLGPETVAGALAVIRALGTIIASFFEAIGRKPYEKTISLGGAGVYMVRCTAGQSSTDGPLVRIPTVAYEVVIVYPGDQLSARYATMQLDRLQELAKQNLELALLLRLGLIPADERNDAEATIADNMRELTADLGAILAHQRSMMVKQRTDLDGPARVDLDVDREGARKELTRLIDDLDKRIGHRAARVEKLPGQKLVRGLGTLVTDRAAPPIHLAYEFAVLGRAPALISVKVLDATSINSGEQDGVGATLGLAVKAALLKLLENDVTGYGRGYCTILVPVEGGPHQQLTFRVNADLGAILVEAIEGMAMIVSVIALVAAPFTAGASLAILVPMGIIGIIPSAYRLATRAAHGTLHWDLQTAMELVDVVSGFIGLGQTATGTLRMLRLSKGFMIMGHGANGLGVLLGNVALLDQIEQIKGDTSMSPAQKRAALMSLIGNKLFQDGIAVGHSLASKARFDLDAGGVDPARLPADARPLPDTAAAPTGAARRRLDPAKKLTAAEPDLVTQAKSIVGQDIAVVRDPSLKGETAEVRYRLDRLGFVAEVIIVLGPRAGKIHLPSHAAVARKLLKFTGVIGKARTLLEWARALVTGRKDRLPDRRAFEARLELEKLPAQLADYLDAAPDRIRTGELTDEQIDAYVKGIEDQLERHHDALYSSERGRGYVAAEDKSVPPDAKPAPPDVKPPDPAGTPPPPRPPPTATTGTVGRFARLADALETVLGVKRERMRVLLAPPTQKHISIEPPDASGVTTVKVPVSARDADVVTAGQAHAERARTKAAGGPWTAADEARLRGRPDAERGHRWELKGDQLEHIGDPPRRYDPAAGTFVDGDPATPPAPRRRPGTGEPQRAVPRRTPEPASTPPGDKPGARTPPAPAPSKPATLGDPPPPTVERQKRHRELFTDPAAEKAFQARLRTFRGNDNPWPPAKFRGGEGQLFHSDREPGRALKRWFTDRVTDKKDSPGKPTSVQLLRDAAKLVDASPELAKHLEVVRVHEEGPDWILRDFDTGSVEIGSSDLWNKKAADAAISASLRLLRAMQRQQPQNAALNKLLSRLSTMPPSANVHWSDDRGKLLIIDLM